MKKKKIYSISIVAVLLFIILTINACSSANQQKDVDAQANAVSLGNESEAENTVGPEADAEEAGSDTADSGAADAEEAGSDTADSGAADAEKAGAGPTDAGAADAEKAGTENAGAPADGTYAPTKFTVEGGTGKVKITCPEVVLAGGETQARIEFSSSHYEWVKVDGVQYDPENADDKDRQNSVFRIPVRLDEETIISGLTTAMSEPHEIEYRLFISLTQRDETSAEESTGNASREDGTQEETQGQDGEDAAAAGERFKKNQETPEPPVLEGLTFVSAMDTAYAETFDIYSYRITDPAAGTEVKSDAAADSGEDGLYRLIDVHGSGQYLLVPQSGASGNASKASGKDSVTQEEILKNLPDSVTVLRTPLDNLYVAATSSMALFDAAGAMNQVKLTGTKEDGWYIDAPKEALQKGTMVYAGKYSAPDYEMLASSGCDLAVESMMILHAPEVKEKLEELGIPVFIDTSSNESHPMGRTEWVRLYGVLTGHEKEAEAFFEEQKKQFAQAETYTNTGKTVAFFSISTNGNVIVRATDDYIPRMIALAGGNYIFEDLLSQSGNSASVRLSMEDFYNTAREADFLIYNATIESPVKSIAELCGKSALLADFKAVQEGNVWQVRRSLYQSPDIAASMITDLHGMLTDEDASGMTFIEKLK